MLARNSLRQPLPSALESSRLISLEDESSLQAHTLAETQNLLEAQKQELRTAQGEIESAQRRNRLLFELAPVGYVTLDLKGRIEQVNAAAATLLGRERQLLEHIGFSNFLARRKDRELFHEHLQRCRTSPLSGERITTELQLRAPAGQVKLVQFTTNSSAAAEKGSHLAAITDITPGKEAEAALRSSEGRLTSILDAVKDAVISVDEDVHIVFFNAAAERMFQLSPAEVKGQPLTRLFHPGQDCHLLALAAAGALGELRGLRADGLEFPIEACISQSMKGSDPFFTLILRDLSACKSARREPPHEFKERQRLEHEITEISERERRSLGQALHDGVCQHLSGVGMMAATLSDVCGQKSDAETAEKLREIASLIRSATNDARDVARGLNPVDVDANGLVTALRDLATRYNVPGKTRYVLHCHEPVPVQDNSVAMHLYRIVQEAVVNASRHARARNITIHLGIRHKDIMLSITDDGIGLPADLDQTSGLGLKLMRYRASSIGATLTLEARAAGGTVVRCRLPSPE
jgi:PAS domain S-box-containing protein